MGAKVIDFEAVQIYKQYENNYNFNINLALDEVERPVKKQWDATSYAGAYMRLLTKLTN
jgi:hypothetical protein